MLPCKRAKNFQNFNIQLLSQFSTREDLYASYALFASWVLEGRGREGKAYGEVNPCLGV